MRNWNCDMFVGTVTVSGTIFFMGYFMGFSSIFTLFLLLGVGAVVPRMWHNEFRFFAIILLPAVLLQCLLPKALRVAVNALPSDSSDVAHTK